MSNEPITSNTNEDLEKEYNIKSLGKGVRGKYLDRYQKCTNVVVIDPDLSKAFPNAKAVNDALRKVLENQKKTASKQEGTAGRRWAQALYLIETPMKIQLSSIVNGIEFQGLESYSYLNLKTGEVILIADEEIRAVENGDDISERAEWHGPIDWYHPVKR